MTTIFGRRCRDIVARLRPAGTRHLTLRQQDKLDRAIAETLEGRLLFNTTASLGGTGVLTVTGDGTAETILVYKTAGNIIVELSAG